MRTLQNTLAANLILAALVFLWLPSRTAAGLEINFLPSVDPGFEFPPVGTPSNVATEIAGALDRAASRWSAFIEDPITVTIELQTDDLGPCGEVNGETLPCTIGAEFSGNGQRETYEDYRAALIAATQNEPDNLPIVSALPATFEDLQFTAPFTGNQDLFIKRALARALGFQTPQTTTVGVDTIIGLNSRLFEIDYFDFDRTDGIDADKLDFESTIVHEVGHALGFGGPGFTPFNLFRFADGVAGSDPSSLADFGNAARDLTSTEAIFDDTISEFPTTKEGGHHWVENEVVGQRYGVMDRTLSKGEFMYIMKADLRVLDLLGYDVVDILLGDLDQNGVVDSVDNDLFIGVLLNGTTDDSIALRADVNQDGAVDFGDIAPFSALLNGGSGGSSPVPEPACLPILASMILSASVRRLGRPRRL